MAGDELARHAAELEREVMRLHQRVEELERENKTLHADLEVSYAERDEIDRRMSAMRKVLHTVLDAFDEGEEDTILAQPLMPEPHWPQQGFPIPPEVQPPQP